MDLRDLLVALYAVVSEDPLLTPYFASLDLPTYMPRIVAFWSTLLFHMQPYSSNAFLPHQAIPGLTASHFAHWVAALEAMVDRRFTGPDASRKKKLVHYIASSM